MKKKESHKEDTEFRLEHPEILLGYLVSSFCRCSRYMARFKTTIMGIIKAMLKDDSETVSLKQKFRGMRKQPMTMRRSRSKSRERSQ